MLRLSLDHHSLRRIARETGHRYRTVAQALADLATGPDATLAVPTFEEWLDSTS